MKKFIVFVSTTEGINENAHTVWKSWRNTYEGLGVIEAESMDALIKTLYEGRYQVFEVTETRMVDVIKETSYRVEVIV
jgi:hypothetical protein